MDKCSNSIIQCDMSKSDSEQSTIKLEYKGYHTKVNYNLEDKVYYGKIEGINDFVNFGAENALDIKNEFHLAVDDYIEMCKYYGKTPEKAGE